MPSSGHRLSGRDSRRQRLCVAPCEARPFFGTDAGLQQRETEERTLRVPRVRVRPQTGLRDGDRRRGVADAMRRRRADTWVLPESPWVLHSTEFLGVLTERWIQTQADAQCDFDARVLGQRIALGAERRANWLTASDRLRLRLLYVGMLKSGGYGGALLGRQFRLHPPAVIHAHFGIVGASHRKLARNLGCPLVASFYGYDASMERFVTSRLWRARYQRLFEEVAAVLVEGPRMAARVAALGCSAEKLSVIRLPADATGLADVVRRPPTFFRVVSAGRFIDKKGFDTGIRAFAKALRGREARLVMVGGGPLEAEYRRLAEDEGITGQVDWLASLPFREFMSQIAGASVAVFPSRAAKDGDTEGGAPVTLIETQWLGVPAVVSEHDDLPFVAAPEGSLCLPPTDVDGWAEALQTLYDNPTLLDSMGAAGAAFARANHSPEGNAAAREAIYANLSGRFGNRSRSLAHA
jgi:colanic acid/amylovoran/stewartan biosynthesis glycosyltransferase WcaL/AmsK/CpsK